MVDYQQNRSLASILFVVKKNTFLHFLNDFSKRKMEKQKLDMDHCCQCDNLSSQSRFQRLFAFQHRWQNFAALSYIEKIKIYKDEVTELQVLLVQ